MTESVVARSEFIVPEPAAAFAALLDVRRPDLERGEALPPLWHWLYLLDRPRQSDLGTDGHPVQGTIPTPPAAGQRRMWAGGRVRTFGGLVCNESAERRSRVLMSEKKVGRSGDLTFLTIEHLVVQRGNVVVEEHQQLVLPSGDRTRSPSSRRLPFGATSRGFEGLVD
jgi:3-methylfumaryl-CoA hydratase